MCFDYIWLKPAVIAGHISQYIYPPITYYWTVPLILDHSGTHISLGNKQVQKLLIQMCQDFRGSKAFVTAIFEFFKFPTRYKWSNIRRPVQ